MYMWGYEKAEKNRALYELKYHFVWIPKYRRKLLSEETKEKLKEIFFQIAEEYDFEIIEQQVTSDHVHLFLSAPPRYSPASLLRKKFFSWLAKVYWKENVVWLLGYFVSTVGIAERKILKYVKWQQGQDSGQAKLELF